MKIQPAVPPSTRLPTEPDSFSPCAIAPSAMGLHPEGPLTTFDDNSEVEAFLQSLAPRERRKILRQLPSDGGWRPQQRRRGVSEATCDGKRQQAYTGHPHPTTLTRMPVLQQQHLEPGGRSTAAGVSPDACDRQPEELDCGIHQCASPNKEGAGGPIRERHQSAAVCYCGNKSSSGSLYLLSSVPGSKSLPAAAGTKGREDCGRRFSLGEPITVQGATCAVCLQHRVTTASRVLQPPGMRSEGRKNVKGPATDEHPPQHLIKDYTNDLKVPPCTTAPGFQKSGRSRLRIRHESAARRAPDVRTIFEQPRDPRVKEERGEGHSFEAAFAGGQTWCDLCGKEVTLSRGGGALRCKNCKFTCHTECKELIQLDCSQKERPSAPTTSPESTLVRDDFKNAVKEERKVLSVPEVKQHIEKYNASVSDCLGMTLNEDGSYTGFIKVHLKLRRPVTVPADVRPQSIYDALNEINPAENAVKRTSFYLPLDVIKQLHISSGTTVGEVIQALLKKFMVLDNPQKFALYKEAKKDKQVLLQKLKLTEHPLYLRLLAGPDTEVLSFTLKENETGDVEWDAFSLPELQNFLMILDREERERIHQVELKYAKIRDKLQEALKEAGENPG